MLLEVDSGERAPTLMQPDLSTRLDSGLAALGLPLSASARARLLQFVALLAQWNRVYNLTAIRAPADMLAVHVLDALAIVPLVDAAIGAGSLLDVGSGAGLPGIPLAIARPEWRIDSVDAVAKKIAFQVQAKHALKLAQFSPHHCRVEALALAERPSVIIARAYTSLASMVDAVQGLSAEHTALVAMKGVVPHGEIAALPPGWRVAETIRLDVPQLGAERCAIVLKRR